MNNMMCSFLYLLLLLLLLPYSRSFTPQRSTRIHTIHSNSGRILFFSSTSNDDDEPLRTSKRRRRRKDADSETTSLEQLKPRSDTPLSLQVQDIRQAVGAKPTVLPEPVAVETSTTMNKKENDDALGKILEDAKRMKELETNSEPNADTFSIRNVISTIVTIDFFVVCAFLLWFLAGIVGSTVFKNDAVQIAFNSNFQQFVQPALGILMIGALSSAVFKEDE